MPYTSPAEDAAKIRAALKARGITSRQVSVKSSSFSMGSAIDVTIKAPGISVKMVREIAETFERVSRCEITGEILSGGNRYVSVTLDWRMLDAAAERFMPWLKALEITGNSMLPVPEMDDFWAGRQSDWQYSLSHDGRMLPVRDAGDVARVLAENTLQAGA